MAAIFNESPVRQGSPFRHYGKDESTIKREFSRYLFREELFGAFFENELIGFIFLAYAGKYAFLGQILSRIEHRDKYSNNALIAKAVEVVAAKNIPFLVYGHWSQGGLDEFKRRNGFQKIDLPRYFVPLTLKGALALKLNAQRGFSPLIDRDNFLMGLIPDAVKSRLRTIKRNWYERK
jgi:hypothetical protein